MKVHTNGILIGIGGGQEKRLMACMAFISWFNDSIGLYGQIEIHFPVTVYWVQFGLLSFRHSNDHLVVIQSIMQCNRWVEAVSSLYEESCVIYMTI